MNVPDAVRKEAALVKSFVAGESDLFAWFIAKLEGQRHGLIALAGRLDLTDGARAVVIGKLSLVEELISTPAKLLTITERTEKAAEPYTPGPAPVGSPSWT